MSHLEALVLQRENHHVLRRVLLDHTRAILGCACWHHDRHGLQRLQERLQFMQLLAERMEHNLAALEASERAQLAL